MCCMWRSLRLWWGQITFALLAQVIFRHHKLSDLLTQLTRLWWFYDIIWKLSQAQTDTWTVVPKQ